MYDYLLNIDYDDLNCGEPIKLNGDNELEYIAYVTNAMEMNKNYLSSLFEKSEIVERP